MSMINRPYTHYANLSSLKKFLGLVSKIDKWKLMHRKSILTFHLTIELG